MSANSKHLRLARRALRTYRTHLFDAVGLMSCDEATRERIAATAKLVQRDIDWTHDIERAANEHLERKVASRRRRAA